MKRLGAFSKHGWLIIDPILVPCPNQSHKEVFIESETVHVVRYAVGLIWSVKWKGLLSGRTEFLICSECEHLFHGDWARRAGSCANSCTPVLRPTQSPDTCDIGICAVSWYAYIALWCVEQSWIWVQFFWFISRAKDIKIFINFIIQRYSITNTNHSKLTRWTPYWNRSRIDFYLRFLKKVNVRMIYHKGIFNLT